MLRQFALGDSITTSLSYPVAKPWEYYLFIRAEPLLGQLASDKYLPGPAPYNDRVTGLEHTLYCCGNPAEHSGEIVARIPTQVLPNAQAGDRCYLMAGINDGTTHGHNMTPAQTMANIDAGCVALAAAGVVPVLCTITPYPAATAPEKQRIRDCNALIRTYAGANGIQLEDAYRILDPADTGSYAETDDGLHPNQAGHAKLGNGMSLAGLAPLDLPSVRTIPGLVGDWRMTSSGILRDALTGALASAAGEPVRSNADLRGREAYCDGNPLITISTAGMSTDEGTILVVHHATGAANGRALVWPSADNARYVTLYHTGPTAAATRVNATGVSLDSSIACGAGADYVHSLLWKTGTAPRAAVNGVLGSTPAAQAGALPAMKSTAVVGSWINGTEPLNEYVSRVVFFARRLTQTEHAQAAYDLQRGYATSKGWQALERRRH